MYNAYNHEGQQKVRVAEVETYDPHDFNNHLLWESFLLFLTMNNAAFLTEDVSKDFPSSLTLFKDLLRYGRNTGPNLVLWN